MKNNSEVIWINSVYSNKKDENRFDLKLLDNNVTSENSFLVDIGKPILNIKSFLNEYIIPVRYNEEIEANVLCNICTETSLFTSLENNVSKKFNVCQEVGPSCGTHDHGGQ